MKKTLALILSLALVLSMLTVGFAFTASAATTDWAAEIAGKWASTTKATYINFKGADGGSAEEGALSAENSEVDLAAAVPEVYAAGTATFADGVVTLTDLQYVEGKEGYLSANGAMKVVIEGCEYKGKIRNDWGAAGAASGIFVEGKNGASWTTAIYASAANVVRSNGSLYVYGDLALDLKIASDGIQLDQGGEIIFAATGAATIEGANLFNVKAEGGKVVIANSKNFTIVLGTYTLFAGENFADCLIENANVTISGRFAGTAGGKTAPTVRLVNSVLKADYYGGQYEDLTKIVYDENSGVFAYNEAKGAYTLLKGIDPTGAVPQPEQSEELTLDLVPVDNLEAEEISINVAWSGTNFVYDAGTLGWNPETLDYDIAPETVGSWTTDTLTVTVTNYTNAILTVGCGVEDKGAEYGATVAVAGEASKELAAAAVKAAKEITFDVVASTIAEATISDTMNGEIIATVTISVAKA